LRICLAVSTEYWRVKDGQTDLRTNRLATAQSALCIASRGKNVSIHPKRDQDDSHSMLHVLSNIMQQRKCVGLLLNITGRHCSTVPICCFRQTAHRHSAVSLVCDTQALLLTCFYFNPACTSSFLFLIICEI